MNIKEIDAKTLAYIGDSVYELYIREHVIINCHEKVNKLHKKTIKYVSAKAQAKIVTNMQDFLSDEEKEIIRQGRNKEANTVPKNTDILTYKMATGFESLIGYLYLKKDTKRLEEIINECISIIERGSYEKKQ